MLGKPSKTQPYTPRAKKDTGKVVHHYVTRNAVTGVSLCEMCYGEWFTIIPSCHNGLPQCMTWQTQMTGSACGQQKKIYTKHALTHVLTCQQATWRILYSVGMNSIHHNQIKHKWVMNVSHHSTSDITNRYQKIPNHEATPALNT